MVVVGEFCEVVFSEGLDGALTYEWDVEGVVQTAVVEFSA
jgi:hypothetical protein